MNRLPRALPLGVPWLGFALSLLLASAGATIDSSEGAVRLPPLIVEQTFHGGAWRYGQLPGFEILSRCNDQTTIQLVTAFQHAQDALRTLLPDRFQLRFDAPQALILYDDELWLAATKEATELLLKQGFSFPAPSSGRDDDQSAISPLSALAEPGAKQTPGKTAERYFANLRLTDADTTTTFAVISRTHLDPQQTFFTGRYLGQILGARRPALPSWFTAGFLAFYQHLTFQESTVLLTRLPREDGDASLIPLADFLSPQDRASPASGMIWLSESELFVRWCLDPQTKLSDSLWQFLDELPSTSDVNDSFTRCFGFTPFAATARLEEYRNRASAGTARWKLGAPTSIPSIPLRDATWSEVSRIKGEWERLVARYARKELPALESIYLNQARQSLRRAYDRGDREGQLLASLALLELEDGHEEFARELLEAAVQKTVVRPRVYFEWAKFLYDEELGRVRRNDGKLSGEQASRILEALQVAEKQAPSLPQVYELIADVWTNCSEKPRAADFAIIDRGVALFPDSHELVYRAATLHQSHGDMAEVHRLIGLGRATAKNETEKSRFDRLAHD